MQTFAGQAGTIIVRGGLDDIPGIGDLTDRVMVFQNTQVRGSSTGASQGRPPKDRLIIINGQLQPRIDIRPGEAQRWRPLGRGWLFPAGAWSALKPSPSSFGPRARKSFPWPWT